jgi:hypothetical protein
MKRLCGLLAAAALLGSTFIPAANAESTGPLAGLEAICVNLHGTWEPNGFMGLPSCSTDLIIWQDVPGSYESNQLAAVGRLCEAAGFSGVYTFGKGLIHPELGAGFLVALWVCA